MIGWLVGWLISIGLLRNESLGSDGQQFHQISTKTNNQLSPQIIEHKKVTIFEVGTDTNKKKKKKKNCGGVIPVYEIRIIYHSILTWISNGNTDMNKRLKNLHRSASIQTDYRYYHEKGMTT